jgi:hypothetical protein
MEVFLVPSRRENRESLRRLFQGYVNDFGAEDGGKIIRVIIDELGGVRVTVPMNGKVRLGFRQSDSQEIIRSLFCRLCHEFGIASGKAIMRKFLLELKGVRISFPDLRDLAREERDNRIRSTFNGSNHYELACVWGISRVSVQRIVGNHAGRRN